MSTAAPEPAGLASAADSRMPRVLQAEPVSRHTRLILYALAGLLVVLEVTSSLVGPLLETWLYADGGAPTSAGDQPSTAVILALATISVVLTLLFAWQPSLAAALVLAGTAVSLLGLVGPDQAHLNPLAFVGGIILGAPLVARYSRAGFAWGALAAVAVLTVAGEVLADPPSADAEGLRGTMIFTVVLAALPTIPAIFVRRTRHRARAREAEAEAREQQVLRAAEQERQRIAAELHDVVAHGLTVITMQAAMLPTQTDPAARAASETAIEEAARQSLVDLRRMLTALRGSDRNAQTAEGDIAVDLPARFDEFESRLHAAGFAVERTLADLDRLPRSMELTVLRVVQESVTNILKHTPRRGTVHLCSRFDDDGHLVLEVTSPLTTGEPRASRVVSAIPSGFGLAGMRERVAVFGGALTAGPMGDGWTVRAVLPTR
ncbi:hypothetical protein KZX06_02790 [Micrococcus sp. EYE_162]|uniref:sensor histidine kinase n=1 Tax=unclassified Micrococcus TaxID=2620948 RepID=UPI00200465E7|nr:MULTISPECIES: histidine kinase [unclassified Micrococcus]MCK6095031.1 hypothetical protein [Micrococcus sp. EYE_212]MCK6170978.1 hypothetical protein [Micrococcus sp. EYE_162]